MTRETETRYLSSLIELRAGEKGKKLGGYALKFNTLSQNLGGFVETIAPGALNKTLADGGDVLCRYQHEDEFLLGRTSSGTLRLVLDEVGLDYEVDLPNTSYANDVAELAARQDVRFSSFAFCVIEDEWGFTEQGFPLRTLLQIQLVDVAPVVSPAYLDTTTGLRHLAEARNLDFDSVRAAAESGSLADLMEVRDEPQPEPETPSEPHVPISLLRQQGDWLSRRPTL